LAERLECVINGQELSAVGLDDSSFSEPPHRLPARRSCQGARHRQGDYGKVQQHRLEMAKAFAVEAVIDGAREDVLARVLQETGPR
jgi:hypothetical protein